MPRTEAENERVRDEQRARILEGAREVFARRGMAATMAEVAAAAGVSQGLAYRYFASKEELFRALVADAMRPVGLPVDASGVPEVELYELLTRILEARRDQPDLFLLLSHVLSDPETPPDLIDAMRVRGQGFVKLLRLLIVQGQAAGEVAADDPDQLVAAVVSYLDGVTRFTISHPELQGRFPDPRIALRMLRP